MRWTMVIAFVGTLAAGSGCRGADAPDAPAAGDDTPSATSAEPRGTLTVTSTAFAEGEQIPRRYTCDGEDLSLPLAWTGVPGDAVSLALVFDDPDAPRGTWVHGVLFDMPPQTAGLDEGATADDHPGGGTLGATSWSKRSWGGPCPPRGQTHRYVVHLYALDARLDLDRGATREQVDEAMAGHVLAEGALMGRYRRAP